MTRLGRIDAWPLEQLAYLCHRNLLFHPEAKHVRAHLRALEVTSEDIKEKELGWDYSTNCLTTPVFTDEGVLVKLLFTQMNDR